MSLCQTEVSSCGACCGLFNLDYPRMGLQKILEDRTVYFAKNVDYNNKKTIISFRENFEEREKSYLKKDATIYNCPFIGYIDLNKKRIGCLIHPIKTGDPKSQNYSFYGASICQSYNCKNNERENIKDWEIFLDSLKLETYQYSNIAGDHILFTRIEDFFYESRISSESMFQDHPDIIIKLLLRNLEKTSSHITSFEIDMESNNGTSKFKQLISHLSLTTKEALYQDLERLSIRV